MCEALSTSLQTDAINVIPLKLCKMQKCLSKIKQHTFSKLRKSNSNALIIIQFLSHAYTWYGHMAKPPLSRMTFADVIVFQCQGRQESTTDLNNLHYMIIMNCYFKLILFYQQQQQQKRIKEESLIRPCNQNTRKRFPFFTYSRNVTCQHKN